MRILIFANNDTGLYLFRRELIETLINVGHSVAISVPAGQYSENLKALGTTLLETKINRRSTNPFADYKLYHSYRSILRNYHPDISLTYTIKPNVYGGIACQKEHIPYIANVTGLGTSIENGGILSRISLYLYKKGLRGAKCVFFQNSTNQRFFVDRGIVSKEKTQLIPGSGVNLDSFPLEPYPSEENGIRLLFVGRIMRDKGIEELLTAITSIHKEYPHVTLDIVGPMEEENWEEAIHTAEAAGVVRYHGLQKDVRPFYKNCHCVVLPSYHEGMANVLLEASATGRAVIATNVPGCRETFEQGVTGLGCNAKDFNSLYRAMKEFLIMSHTTRVQMGRYARLRIEQLFSRDIVIHKYLDIL